MGSLLKQLKLNFKVLELLGAGGYLEKDMITLLHSNLEQG
jgi:hypothetical protein